MDFFRTESFVRLAVAIALAGGWSWVCGALFDSTTPFRKITAYLAMSLIGTMLGVLVGITFFSKGSSGHMPNWGAGVGLTTLFGLILGVVLASRVSEIKGLYLAAQFIIAVFVFSSIGSALFSSDGSLEKRDSNSEFRKGESVPDRE